MSRDNPVRAIDPQSVLMSKAGVLSSNKDAAAQSREMSIGCEPNAAVSANTSLFFFLRLYMLYTTLAAVIPVGNRGFGVAATGGLGVIFGTGRRPEYLTDSLDKTPLRALFLVQPPRVSLAQGVCPVPIRYWPGPWSCSGGDCGRASSLFVIATGRRP